MKAESRQQYDHLAHFEPLLPSEANLTGLVCRSRSVVEAALRLQGALPSTTRAELRELVRAMNSYYSNSVEGQSTHPLHIESALRKDFYPMPSIAKGQRIAVAHIEAEKELEGLKLPEAEAFKSETLRKAHESLYRRLQPDDRVTDEGLVVVPGQWLQVTELG